MAAHSRVFGTLFALALCTLGACGAPAPYEQKEPGAQGGSDPKAFTSRMADQPQPSQASDEASFALSVRGDAVALRKDALGQVFALKPQHIEATNAPRIEKGAMKLVTFVQRGNTLAMMEPALHAVYATLPSERLLQTFAIQSQDATHVVFSWPTQNTGLFFRMAQAPADLAPLVRQYVSASDPIMPISEGLLLDIHAHNGVLTLQHVVRAVSNMPQDPMATLLGEQPSGAQESTTFYSTLQLSPYTDNARYQPKHQSAALPPYFLQVPRGQLHASDVDFIAMTWDSHDQAGPVIYDIADDVPEQLLPAIVQGVLYWNRAAQKNLVAVRTGVSSTLAPEPRHVPIRWIPWHRPGAASMAEMQPDPLTGEILGAEIYLASSFYEPSGKLLAHATLTARQSQSSGLTCMAPRVAAPTLLETVDDSDGRSFVQRAMADNMRATVAHEVGHTLGLRHNFAASLDSLPLDADGPNSKRALWRAYSQGDTMGAQLSSSVMDYLPDVDTMLLGAYIKHEVLPYDAWVMTQGYNGANSGSNDAFWDGQISSPWLFCSDFERLGGTLGCRPFDSSPNPFAGALSEAQETLRNMPVELVLQLTSPGQLPLDEAALKRSLASLRMERFTLPTSLVTQELFNGLRPGVQVLPVERKLGYLRYSDPLTYNQANVAQRKQWLDAVGGLPGIVQGLLGAPGQWNGQDSTQVLGWMTGAVHNFVSHKPSATAASVSGRDRLDPHSQALLKQYLPQFSTALEQALLTDLLLTLTGEGPKVGKMITTRLLDPLGRFDGKSGMDPALVEASWELPLCDWAEELIMAQGPSLNGNNTWELRKPALNLNARLAALRLVAPEVFHVSTWGQEHRERMAVNLLQRLFVLVDRKLLKQKIDANSALRSLGLAGFEDLLRLPQLPEAERLWAKDELQFVRALMTLSATKRLPPDNMSPANAAQLFQ